MSRLGKTTVGEKAVAARWERAYKTEYQADAKEQRESKCENLAQGKGNLVGLWAFSFCLFDIRALFVCFKAIETTLIFIGLTPNTIQLFIINLIR